MGLIKDRHGTWCVQRKVPERLQNAVARVLNNGKRKQVYLKKSLGTKELKTANIRATSVIAGFDRIFASATTLADQVSVPAVQRQSLNGAEIARMAEALYGKLLSDDATLRFGGRAQHAREIEQLEQIQMDGWDFTPRYSLDATPEFGWSSERLNDEIDHNDKLLRGMQEALARGDISAVGDDVATLLGDFQIDLDKTSPSYHELGTQALLAYVRALQAIEKRNAGEAVETPKFTEGFAGGPTVGGTLRDAFDGWNKERSRPAGTVHEYKRAVEMFIQLHSDLTVAELKKSHAREFRQALQLVPSVRSGRLKEATLPELADFGRKHPEVPKVSAGTVNKQLGAVQAISGWAHHNGLVSEDTPWADPFQKMRVEEVPSSRGPFDARELQKVFSAPLFTANKEPEGAKGSAGVWLPLLALFTGARQGEIAGLKVENVRDDEAPGTPLLFVVADRKAGKRVKTKSSERVIPVHPLLVKLGFLKYVEERKRAGNQSWLFPTVAPDQAGAPSAWGKWWSRYLRNTVGIADADRVFHSFRHGFQDALRRTTPDEELRDALAGRSNQKSVSRTYGAKNMLDRWGAARLKGAVSKISYPGLDLSRVRPFVVIKPTRTRK